MNSLTKTFRRVISFVLCAFMLLNMVVVGYAERTMGAKMYWTNDISAQDSWKDVENADSGTVFEVSGFESGSETVRYLKIENAGSLAFSYVLGFVSEETVDSLANVIDVYYKSEVTENTAVADMTRIGTLAEVINGNAVSTGKMLPADLVGDGFYSGSTTLALALKMQDNASKEYMNKSLTAFSLKLDVNEYEFEYPEVDKFELVFENTDKYLYRVGNANTVKLGSLFKAIDGADIGNVNVTIEAIDTEANASGTFSANTSDWKASTIQFTGTGSVKVTIDDDDEAKALSLNLEVVNAMNATSATNAIEYDVVLLNDVTFSTLTVSGGHTIYGNGFTMTNPNDMSASSTSSCYIELNNGTLDNVRVICPNFAHSVLYESNKEDDANTKLEPILDNNNFYSMRSAVKMNGDSRVANSYISGGRAAIYATSGNPKIINSTIYGGATANIHLVKVNELLLEDATLIQKPIKANVHNSDRIIMGLSVIAVCESDGTASPIRLEGDFVQYAWANESYSSYVPSAGQGYVSQALAQTDYLHDITYEDGVTRKSLDLGIFYLPSDAVSLSSNKPDNLKDNRINKDDIPFDMAEIKALSFLDNGVYVYSYKNTNGTADSYKTEPQEAIRNQGNVLADVDYTPSAENVTYVEKYDDSHGRMSSLTAPLDILGSYSFDFNDLKFLKYGRELVYTVKDSNGNTLDKSQPINLTESGVHGYTIEIADNLSYDTSGNLIEDKVSKYTHYFDLIATKTDIVAPELVGEITPDTAYLLVKSKNDEWTCGIPASLDGINIKYYSEAKKAYKTINLGSEIALEQQGKLNGTSTTWTYTPENADYTVTITGGIVHTNGTYTMPIGVSINGENKLYYAMSSDSGYVRTGTDSRTVNIKYEFKDKNGKTWTQTKPWQFNYAEYKNGTQYSYSDFVDGNLKEASSGGGGCFKAGTLITLAGGSKKKVEDLTMSDTLLAWDFFKGEYVEAPLSIIINHNEIETYNTKLIFEDGTELEIADEHDAYDADLKKFVVMSHENVNEYIGHNFVKSITNENGEIINQKVKLVDYEISEEYNRVYSLATVQHYNCIANNILTVTPDPVKGWYDYFEIDDNMKYIQSSIDENIEKYGLYTYDDFSDYLTYEEFIAFNCPYLKIPVGKGHFSYDDILGQIELWVYGYAREENPPSPLSDEGASINIIAPNNTVSTGVYGIEIASENATLTDSGAYICDSKNSAFTITATGNASTGYAIITVDGDTLYTGQIAQGESIVINVKNALDKSVSFDYNWGSSVNYGVSQDNLYETGSTIDLGEVSIASVEKTDKGVLVKFSNTTKYDTTGDVYVAVYDATSKSLVRAARVGGFSVLSGGCEHEEIIELPENCTLKAFLWSTSGMVPVTASLAN